MCYNLIHFMNNVNCSGVSPKFFLNYCKNYLIQIFCITILSNVSLALIMTKSTLSCLFTSKFLPKLLGSDSESGRTLLWSLLTRLIIDLQKQDKKVQYFEIFWLSEKQVVILIEPSKKPSWCSTRLLHRLRSVILGTWVVLCRCLNSYIRPIYHSVEL